jgi:hypothetical protein
VSHPQSPKPPLDLSPVPITAGEVHTAMLLTEWLKHMVTCEQCQSALKTIRAHRRATQGNIIDRDEK